MISVIYIIIGIAVVLFGAERLTDGATSLANRMNIPPMVVGLTVVAMGTSMPEFFVSFMSAVRGTPDLAVGNVVGSNIFNTLMIVGVAAMVTPIVISRSTVRKDMPFTVGSSLLLLLLCIDGSLSRMDAAVLFACFICFIAYTLYMARAGKVDTPADESVTVRMSLSKSLFFVFLGLSCLVVGSNAFVGGAVDIARALNISEAVIGITIVAGGTSLPELSTSVVAARKGQSAIAMGNVIGSNVFNILMILGITGLVSPMHIQGITPIDFCVMLGSILLLWLFSYTKYTVARWEGALLVALLLGYMSFLVYNL